MSDMEQYLDVFIEESREHLQNINTQLMELEKNTEDILIVQEIFRSAHTLKGMAGTMGYEDLANLTHKMENVLDMIRNNQLKVTPLIIDVICISLDHLENMVNSISQGGDGKANVDGVVAELEKIESGNNPGASTKTNRSKKAPQFEYDQYESALLLEAKEQKQNVFEIKVTVDKGSVLKGVRAYMVFRSLEEQGEIIKSSPSVEQIENEEFDLSFSIVLITSQDENMIKETILGISEIQKVEITRATTPQQNEELDTKEETLDEKLIESPKEMQKNVAPSQNRTIRVNIERLDNLMNLFEELIIDRGRLEQISQNLNNSELKDTVQRMTRVSGDLQNIILNMRMVQVESVFNRFPRMVRQLSRELGKNINFVIEGADTELDRTVIDDIGDPLVHLIRNALDHGIESPEQRVAKGKPEQGTIVLKAYYKGNMVYIDIEDDGGGLNQKKILEKAIENRVISAEQANNLSSDETNQLIFASGFSTADTVSDISGRGVGLDVVKSNIERLSGSIIINSEEGKGSTFSIELPLTLSIIASMLVKVRNEQFAVPLTSIVETAIIYNEEIQHVHNQKVIIFREKVIPLIFLDEYYQVPGEAIFRERHCIVIVQRGNEIVGLVVDDLIGQQEIVLKSLGEYMKDTHSISGATILGNGTVALIIDSATLIGRKVSRGGQ